MTKMKAMLKELLSSCMICVMLLSVNVYAFDNIEKGSTGDTVKELQQALINLGYLTGVADGQFGGMTEEAVKAWQSANSLDATGIVDENTYEKISTASLEYVAENAPEGMIIDEEQWKAWKVSGQCKLFPFMGAAREAGYTFTVPWGQSDSDHKTVSFVFKDGDSKRTLDNVEMYYGVTDQAIIYTGLWTDDESVFKSEDFKEACIRLMLGYNIHYDSETESPVLNLTRERAEEVVSYCLDNIEHCLVDDMRIRVLREADRDYYSFHMEY